MFSLWYLLAVFFEEFGTWCPCAGGNYLGQCDRHFPNLKCAPGDLDSDDGGGELEIEYVRMVLFGMNIFLNCFLLSGMEAIVLNE